MMVITGGILQKSLDFSILCQWNMLKYLYSFGSSVAFRFDILFEEISLKQARKIVGFANV